MVLRAVGRFALGTRFRLAALAGGIPLLGLVVWASEADRLRHALIGVVLLGLGLVVAGRLASSTGRALARLADDAERFARDDRAHRSAVADAGEVGMLVARFNAMADVVQAREAALERSRRQLNAIADNIPAQIVYIDRDERYRYVNGYRSKTPDRITESIIGKPVREVRGEKIYAMVADDLRRALAGEPRTFEALSPTPGPVHWFRTAMIPDLAEDGAVKGIYSFSQDVTERKTAELLRDVSEQRLRTIADNLPAMICYVDPSRCFRFANRAFEKWLERPLADIVGRPFGALMPDDLATRFERQFDRAMQGVRFEHDFEVTVRRGGRRWLRCAFIPDANDADGTVRGVYGMIANVTRAKRAEQRLSRLARIDTLTGLANRHRFEEILQRALSTDDEPTAPLALMFLDVDHFKQINDRYGHGAGDALLKAFGHRLTDCVRVTDTVARLSGDEFVVLLEGLHSDDEPQFVARKIIAAVEKPVVLDEHAMRVTTSIGIALRRSRHEAASTLMKRADEALYEAKRAGRNTFRMAG